MGTYTGIRVRGRLKAEFVPAIAFVLKYRRHLLSHGENPWLRAAVDYPSLAAVPGYLDFAQKERAQQIPCTQTTIDAWTENDPDWATRVDGDLFVLESAIKNYDNEYKAFIGLLPSLCTFVEHCEVIDECLHREGALYELVGDQMVRRAEALWYRDDRFGCVDDDETRWRSPWQLAQGNAEMVAW